LFGNAGEGMFVVPFVVTELRTRSFRRFNHGILSSSLAVQTVSQQLYRHGEAEVRKIAGTDHVNAPQAGSDREVNQIPVLDGIVVLVPALVRGVSPRPIELP